MIVRGLKTPLRWKNVSGVDDSGAWEFSKVEVFEVPRTKYDNEDSRDRSRSEV